MWSALVVVLEPLTARPDRTRPRALGDVAALSWREPRLEPIPLEASRSRARSATARSPATRSSPSSPWPWARATRRCRRLPDPDLTTTVLTMTLTGLAADSRIAGGSGQGFVRRRAATLAMLTGASQRRCCSTSAPSRRSSSRPRSRSWRRSSTKRSGASSPQATPIPCPTSRAPSPHSSMTPARTQRLDRTQRYGVLGGPVRITARISSTEIGFGGNATRPQVAPAAAKGAASLPGSSSTATSKGFAASLPSSRRSRSSPATTSAS